MANESKKFERVFADLKELREDVVTIKAHEEDEQRRLTEMAKSWMAWFAPCMKSLARNPFAPGFTA